MAFGKIVKIVKGKRNFACILHKRSPIMKEDPEWDDLILKKLGGLLSPEEEQRLTEHLNSDTEAQTKFNQYQTLWYGSRQLQLREGLTGQARWDNLQKKIIAASSAKSTTYRKIIWRYAVAACVLLLLLFVFFPRTSAVKISTLKGERKTITLPDRSVVILNAETRLTYDPASWEAERSIELKGEAYFEVKKNGLPFTVTSADLIVKVLGTTFNIKSRNNITTVVCATGKVSVGSKNDRKNSVVLHNGYGVTANGANLNPAYAVSPNDEISWVSGDLYFRDAPLKEVFAELERRFNKSIRLQKNTATQTFTGKFKHAEFHHILETVCLSAGLQYSIAGDSVAIVE
jgi:transmembrane sensor